MGITITVQEHRRFYREGLVTVLDSEPDLEVVGSAADAEGLVRIFEESNPDVVLLELDTSDWDPFHLATTLRHQRRDLVVVGIARSADRPLVTRAVQAGLRAIVTRDGGIPALLQAVRLGPGRLDASDVPVTRHPPSGSDDHGAGSPTRNALTPR